MQISQFFYSQHVAECPSHGGTGECPADPARRVVGRPIGCNGAGACDAARTTAVRRDRRSSTPGYCDSAAVADSASNDETGEGSRAAGSPIVASDGCAS